MKAISPIPLFGIPILIRVLPFLFLTFYCSAQIDYFPPPDFNTWESSIYTCDPDAKLELLNFLEEKNTKAFIILKHGNILMEEYFGDFGRDSIWYWASAGKTLTSVLIGIAAENGDLFIDDPTEDYLGEWTSCDSLEQEKITIRHQLTMTTGFDETISFDCTDPECLECIHEPETRWFYHNAPYTLLQDVYESATGLSATQGFHQHIGQKIGALGAFIPLALTDNKIFFSRARDMARFGLLVAANGDWNGNQVFGNSDYFIDMRNTSQELNKAYGYLWWLNGKESFHLPGTDIEFNGSIIPTGPADMYMGLGKNDQKLYIVPSEDLVVVRLGDAADDLNSALSTFDRELWTRISQLNCEDLTSVNAIEKPTWNVFPNPTSEFINISGRLSIENLSLMDGLGKLWYSGKDQQINIANYPRGVYWLKITSEDGVVAVERVVIY